MADDVLTLEIEQILANRYQPRQAWEEEELDSLAASIRSVGLIHPPIVRPIGDGRYELIAGERRLRACRRLGHKHIPVHVRHSSHSASAEAALVENLQRVDLNPIEVARALRRLVTEFGLKQEQLAERVGKKRSTVANYLRVLTLPHSIQEALEARSLSMGHAKAILALAEPEAQHQLFNKILQEEMTVREAELWASKESAPPKPENKRPKLPSPDLFFYQDLEERLQSHLGTKVKINPKGKGGTILIDYYSLDDLDRALEAMGVDEER